MKYRLKIAEEISDLDVSHSGSNVSFQVTMGERIYDVRYQVICRNHFVLRVNDRPVEAFVVQGEGGKEVFVNGRTFFIQDADHLPLRRATVPRSEETPGEVTPPMPAVVVRILVEEGEEVKRGQGLVVVSAMKMETTLVAPADGRVKRINTSLDAKVIPGDILVEIEEEERGNE